MTRNDGGRQGVTADSGQSGMDGEGVRADPGREEIGNILSVQLYDPPSCRLILDQAAAVTWADARVIDPASGETPRPMLDRASRSARVSFADSRSHPARGFDVKMEAVVLPLVRRTWRIDLTDYSRAQLIRYRSRGHYRPHSDEIAGPVKRYFSVICYLNEDFAGGRTVFPAFDHSVTPKTGQAIIFPAGYPHYAEPVTAGEKYVIASWVTGPPPVRWF